MTTSSPKGKILVVDDEPYITELVAYDLAQRGHEVKEANSGNAALALLKSEPFDLVLSDVRMPSGTGVDLLKGLMTWKPDGPGFIFMTAFADISSDEALALGAQAFLTKPLLLPSLFEEVEKALVPPPERWCKGETFDGVERLVVRAADILAGIPTPVVALGRGGVFVAIDGGFPESLEIIAFEVPLADGVISGFGRVRWVRYETTEGFPSGIGLEFLSLPPEPLALVLRQLAAEVPKAYIPLGP